MKFPKTAKQKINFFSIFLLIISVSCGSTNSSGLPRPGENEVSIQIGCLYPERIKQKVIVPGLYTAMLREVNINEGSYSGFGFTFCKQENDGEMLRLVFELPAAGKFRLSMDNGSLETVHPECPFHANNSDFSGLMNVLSGTEQATFIALDKTTKANGNEPGRFSCSFSFFDLHVISVSSDKDRFSMEAEFSGSTDSLFRVIYPESYTINGRFRIHDAAVTLTMVD